MRLRELASAGRCQPETARCNSEVYNYRLIHPMNTVHVPVSVPVGLTGPYAARASASLHMMPCQGPSTADGGQVSSWQRTPDCPPPLGLPRRHLDAVIIYIYQ